MVCGDNKQLPPTNFFKVLLDDNDEVEDNSNIEEASEEFESILDECIGRGFPEKKLRWHYRSRHENLISFSNSYFYNNDLVIFPTPFRNNENLGVKLVYVKDGIYDRGGKRNNRREAEVISQIVYEHFNKFPRLSLGVVTFSKNQADTIEDYIELMRKSHPEIEKYFKEDRLEGFFVKNLENVQGDERDVIIISVGYARDKSGNLTMNFGPLNLPGGERRLNVLVTRARREVILVSSIKYSDMRIRENTPKGVKLLYQYLKFAEEGPKVLDASLSESKGDFESPFEEDVAAVIRSWGYEVVPQVGVGGYRIDIGVIDPANPGKFILGVECDGVTYHSLPTARDRDRLRQEVLENLGWKIHRIWSADWFFRREKEKMRLKRVLERLRKENRDSSTFRLK